jgi:hypothetical protein
MGLTLRRELGNSLTCQATTQPAYDGDDEGLYPPGGSEAIMADLLFVVSRTEPKQYFYLKHAFADERRDVVLDRRVGERRRSLRPSTVDRRHIDRRQRDVTRELQSAGWALVRRPSTYTAGR